MNAMLVSHCIVIHVIHDLKQVRKRDHLSQILYRPRFLSQSLSWATLLLR